MKFDFKVLMCERKSLLLYKINTCVMYYIYQIFSLSVKCCQKIDATYFENPWVLSVHVLHIFLCIALYLEQTAITDYYLTEKFEKKIVKRNPVH